MLGESDSAGPSLGKIPTRKQAVGDRILKWNTLGEYAASTHYWTSPKDDLIVVTLQQTMPYSFLTEFAVKGLIYEAIEKK